MLSLAGRADSGLLTEHAGERAAVRRAGRTAGDRELERARRRAAPPLRRCGSPDARRCQPAAARVLAPRRRARVPRRDDGARPRTAASLTMPEDRAYFFPQSGEPGGACRISPRRSSIEVRDRAAQYIDRVSPRPGRCRAKSCTRCSAPGSASTTCSPNAEGKILTLDGRQRDAQAERGDHRAHAARRHPHLPQARRPLSGVRERARC